MYKEGEPLNLMEYYEKPDGDNTLEVSTSFYSLYTLSDFHPFHLTLTPTLLFPTPLPSPPHLPPISFPRSEFQHTV